MDLRWFCALAIRTSSLPRRPKTIEDNVCVRNSIKGPVLKHDSRDTIYSFISFVHRDGMDTGDATVLH